MSNVLDPLGIIGSGKGWRSHVFTEQANFMRQRADGKGEAVVVEHIADTGWLRVIHSVQGGIVRDTVETNADGIAAVISILEVTA